MNERESLINLLTSWIKKTRDHGLSEDIYLTGSILRESDFSDDSDIDLIITGNNVDLDTIKNSLMFVNVITQRSIDITHINSDYIDNFSLLYKNANVIEGFCLEQPFTPLASRLMLLPYFQSDLQVFWYAHLLLRRLALQKREPVNQALFARRLKKYIKWLNIRTNQASVNFGEDEKVIANKALQLGRDFKLKIIGNPPQPLKTPLEKYLHIAYWNNVYNFESVSNTHQFVEKVSLLNEALFTQVAI